MNAPVRHPGARSRLTAGAGIVLAVGVLAPPLLAAALMLVVGLAARRGAPAATAVGVGALALFAFWLVLMPVVALAAGVQDATHWSDLEVSAPAASLATVAAAGVWMLLAGAARRCAGQLRSGGHQLLAGACAAAGVLGALSALAGAAVLCALV